MAIGFGADIRTVSIETVDVRTGFFLSLYITEFFWN